MPVVLRPWKGLLPLTTAAAASVGVAAVAATPADEAAYRHIMNAKAAAGDALKSDFYNRCFVDPNYKRSIAAYRRHNAPIDPARVFDNLYFVGQNNVSAWALKTSQGIIVFDSLNTPAEAQDYIAGGLTRLGLDPAQIKYVVVMHEHSDHFGGAKYLHDTYGATVLAASAAWEGMARYSGPAIAFVPRRDGDIADGQSLTLGDTTVRFYATPGHSPGTISALIGTTDNGAPHVAALFGGLGTPKSDTGKRTLVGSLNRWKKLSAAAGVDTLIANHQGQDSAVEKLELLRIRRARDPNPFVLGKALYQRYLTVQVECTLALEAVPGRDQRGKEAELQD